MTSRVPKVIPSTGFEARRVTVVFVRISTRLLTWSMLPQALAIGIEFFLVLK